MTYSEREREFTFAKTIFKILLKLLLSTAGATLCGQASATLWLVWARAVN